MPFDPSYPPANAEIESAPLRSQFVSLFDLIQAVPAGPQGPPGNDGAQGPPFAQAVVDGVSTLNPGDAASVSVSFDGTNVHFTFGIPRGSDGSNGADGTNGTSVSGAVVDGVSTLEPYQAAAVNVNFDTGSQVLHFSFGIPRGQNGDAGPPGPQGPVFGNAVVDGVNTLDPGQPAAVQSWFDGSTVHFTFGIPRGNDGSNGTNGSNGADGQQGPQGPPFASAVVDSVTTLNPWEQAWVQSWFDGTNVHLTFGIPRGSDGGQGPQGEQGIPGPPGEVSNAQLNSAINGTSNNSNGVSTLSNGFNDPETEELRNKVNELINALRR